MTFHRVNQQREVTMRDLIVVGFEGTHRAAEVLSQVLDLNADWAADLHIQDAVAVYRTTDGKLRVDESVQPTSKEGAAWGGALGVVIGSLLALPFTGGASAARRAGVSRWTCPAPRTRTGCPSPVPHRGPSRRGC